MTAVSVDNASQRRAIRGLKGLRLPWVAFPIAILNWVCIAAHWTTLQNISKPATIVVLILWFHAETRNIAHGWSSPRTWFLIGLLFSLGGDVLLIPSGSGYFDAGLACFLAAHVCYIAGFNRPWVAPGRLTAVFALVLGTYAVLLYRHLYPHLPGAMKIIVAVYATALTLMALSSLETWRRPDWVHVAALLASAGGLIFLSSDSMLALNRFITTKKDNELAVMMTYYLGQFGIISGVVNRRFEQVTAVQR